MRARETSFAAWNSSLRRFLDHTDACEFLVQLEEHIQSSFAIFWDGIKQ
jgi:hypothetical protein